MLNDVVALYAAYPAWFAGVRVRARLMVGSFLNVVIYRLPIMMEREWREQTADFMPPASTAAPSSAHQTPSPSLWPRRGPRVPPAEAPIKAIHNIPVLSWLALRGRCAACRAPISPRYPAVELGRASCPAWAAWHFGFGPSAVCAMAVTWALIALTGIDIDHQLLPDSITLPLLWAGLLAAVVIGRSPARRSRSRRKMRSSAPSPVS